MDQSALPKNINDTPSNAYKTRLQEELGNPKNKLVKQFIIDTFAPATYGQTVAGELAYGSMIALSVPMFVAVAYLYQFLNDNFQSTQFATAPVDPILIPQTNADGTPILNADGTPLYTVNDVTFDQRLVNSSEYRCAILINDKSNVEYIKNVLKGVVAYQVLLLFYLMIKIFYMKSRRDIKISVSIVMLILSLLVIIPISLLFSKIKNYDTLHDKLDNQYKCMKFASEDEIKRYSGFISVSIVILIIQLVLIVGIPILVK